MSNYSSIQSSSMPEQELVELLWEDGQVVMQGQTNRNKKSTFPSALSYNDRLEVKFGRDDTALPMFGQSGATDSGVSDLTTTVACGSQRMNAPEVDTAQWINYSIDDSLQNNDCLEFLSELTEVHLNSLSDKSNGYGDQSAKDVHNTEHELIIPKSFPGGSEPSRNRNNNLFQFPQHCHNSSQNNFKSRVLDLSNTSGCSSHLGNSDGDLQNTRFQKQDIAPPKPTQPSISTGLIYLPHFSKSEAPVKANVNGIDRLRNHEKSCAAASAYPIESTLVESANGLRSLCGIQGSSSSNLLKVDSGTGAKAREEVIYVGHSETQWPKDSQGNLPNALVNTSNCSPDSLNCQASSFVASTAMERYEIERGTEAIVTSSSVCSGYNAGATSSDPKHKSKRRACEAEESGNRSDDLEDECFATKKHAARMGTGAKGSRAAEVHNLSERRRRDRINKKMRALQELIPNCNKVDKASMLDEAIEYLKSLQQQVQMMSMGSGLCMPSMMFPVGINNQHMRAQPMPHFSPVGVGMGMGMSVGMGMIGLNGLPGLTPVPPMHGAAQCQCLAVPGIHSMPPSSSSIHSFGIPGQRIPFSARQAPLFTFQGGLPPLGTTMDRLPVSDSTTTSNNRQQQCINLGAINKDSKVLASQEVNPLMQEGR